MSAIPHSQTAAQEDEYMPDEQASESVGASTGPAKRSFDTKFLRNMKVLGGVTLTAIAAVVFIVYRSNAAITGSAEGKLQKSGIDMSRDSSISASTGSSLTEVELERLRRVGTARSEAAQQAGATFIPKDMPLMSADSLSPPNVQDQGPGPLRKSSPDMSGGASQQGGDPQRDGRLSQGLNLQIQSMLTALAVPETSQAGPYKGDGASGRAGATQPETQAVAVTPVAQDWINGLSIHGAELTSPLETEKTDYISARVTTGPAKDALLFGSGVVVGTDGVRLTFTRMSFEGKAYAIQAVALDTATSSNAMEANIDRKIFSRYVIPIFGAMGEAYMQAVARPPQQVVVVGLTSPGSPSGGSGGSGVSGVSGGSGGSGNIAVVTPGATAKEAAAAGIGAGIGKAASAATYSGPNTASMPVGASIGILFNNPVKKQAT